MRKERFLAVGLAIVLLVGSVIPTYAYKVEKDEETYNIVVTELEDGYISTLENVAVESDLVMLDDIVERSYNNNFDVKSYIIKSADKKLDTTHWNMYLRSRGDIQTQAQFDHNGVVEAKDDMGNVVYYHSITASPYPEWDVGYFSYETRKFDEDMWNAYIEGIREAEKEIGYFEIEDEEYIDNALCDYQLMIQTYAWIAENITHGIGIETEYSLSGQQAFFSIIEKTKPACAGYARLVNRFMHDFGIDSYYVSIPSMTHAVNFVKLNNKYYCADTYDATINKYNDYYNKYNKDKPLSSSYCNLFVAITKADIYEELNYYKELTAITHYNVIFDNSYSKENLISIEPKSDKTDEGLFEKQSMYDKNCVYCSKHHIYPFGENVIINDYSDRIVDGSYFFEAKYRRFDYDIWSYVYEQSFHIYEGSGADEAEKNHLCEEIDTQIEEKTTAETTKESPAEEATTAEAVVVATTKPEEVPTIRETGTVVPADEITSKSEVVPSKPVETTSETIAYQTTTEVSDIKATEPVMKANAAMSGKPAKVTVKNTQTRKIKITWKKVKNAKKYQVQYSTSKKFKKRVVLKTTKKLKYTIKKLIKGKTYYIRVRGVNGKKVGKWSKIQKIKIKK